jgi:hypothetical protein
MISIEEFAKIIPVRPPTVNKKTNPNLHNVTGLYISCVPCNVAIHLKILIPVGTAIIIVAEVKYARVSTSSPIVNIWWAHTTKPSKPIANMA